MLTMRSMKNPDRIWCWTILLLMGTLGLSSCETQVGGLPGQTGEVAQPARMGPGEESALRETIGKERASKDDQFRTDADSPIADAYRREFRGLAYYPIDLRYIFQGRIHRLPEGKQLKIPASDGELRDARHWGYFRFQCGESTVCTLQVYKLRGKKEPEKEILFIPFRDKNAGKETYGGGRYIDLEENSEGEYTVDFNRAYNPYCAYGKSYSCPIPPRENSLSVAIPAGEKAFP